MMSKLFKNRLLVNVLKTLVNITQKNKNKNPKSSQPQVHNHMSTGSHVNDDLSNLTFISTLVTRQKSCS